jgi:hypothetical protein
MKHELQIRSCLESYKVIIFLATCAVWTASDSCSVTCYIDMRSQSSTQNSLITQQHGRDTRTTETKKCLSKWNFSWNSKENVDLIEEIRLLVSALCKCIALHGIGENFIFESVYSYFCFFYLVLYPV